MLICIKTKLIMSLTKYGCWLFFIVPTFVGGLGLCLTALSQPHDSGPGAPLEGAVTGMALLAGLGLILIAALCGFFLPRSALPELVGDQLTTDHVSLVTQHTLIVFPPAARLVGLCHQHPVITSHVATKFELPESSRESFLQNAIFHVGIERPPHYQLGSSTSWWQRDRLEERIDRVQYLPSGTYVECSVGIEDGHAVVYVSWA